MVTCSAVVKIVLVVLVVSVCSTSSTCSKRRLKGNVETQFYKVKKNEKQEIQCAIKRKLGETGIFGHTRYKSKKHVNKLQTGKFRNTYLQIQGKRVQI